MSLKNFTTLDEAKAFAVSLGAPARSLKIGQYDHKASGNKVFYVTVSNKTVDSDKAVALQKLVEAEGVDAVVAALTSGKSLAAGVRGREMWGEKKEGAVASEDLTV